MLPLTQEHQRFIQPKQPRLRVGAQVPPDSVGLAYTYVPALTPQENITIVDTSSFILENINSEQDALLYMWPDDTRRLQDQEGHAEIPSQSLLQTNIFADGQPLFYAHKCQYPIYDPAGPDSFGFYKGTGVLVRDLSGQPLPSHLKYRIILLRTQVQDYYWVLVYTSFQTGGIDNYRVQYSAVQQGQATPTPRIGYAETLNPQPAFRREKDILAVVGGDPNAPHYYLANAPEFGQSRIYVSRTLIPDTRTPVSFRYTITAQGIGDVVQDAPSQVLCPSSVLAVDFEPYANGSLVLVPDVRALAAQQGMILSEDTIFTIISSNPQVRVSCRPDGRGPALATTRANTGKAIVPDEYVLVTRADGRYFNPTYAIRLMDHRQIRALPPLETESLENWYLRVQNGRFKRTSAAGGTLQTYGYFLPEYYRQHWDAEYGMPYRYVADERPQIVGERRVRVRRTPIYVAVDENMQPDPHSLKVIVNGRQMPVASWSVGDGTIELAGAVQETDEISVQYHCEENNLTYRGFWDQMNGRFWHLDLNPGPGHLVTMQDVDGQIKDVPAFQLLDRTIYLYLRAAAEMSNVAEAVGEDLGAPASTVEIPLGRPALTGQPARVYLRQQGTDVPYGDSSPDGTTWSWKTPTALTSPSITIHNPAISLDAGGHPMDAYAIDYSYASSYYRILAGTFHRDSLFHTFEEQPDNGALLLAKILVRPNSVKAAVQIRDTRVRGGGLKPEVTEALIKELEPLAKQYWDIGYWDGKPFRDTGVVVIRLSHQILKEYGGQFDRQDVEEIVAKHIAWGILPIIEYVEDDLIVDRPGNLVIDTVTLDPQAVLPPQMTALGGEA